MADIRLDDIVDTHGPWFPLGQIYKKLRCAQCNGKAAFPPRIVSSLKPGRAAGVMTYHQWFKVLRSPRHPQNNPQVRRMMGGRS